MAKYLLFFSLLWFNANGQGSGKCNLARVEWIADSKIQSCKFIPPTVNSQYIEKIEFGNIIDPTSSSYHCYYVETKICKANDCVNCNQKYIFNLMLSNKQFIAPTDEIGKIGDCSATLVNIPPSIINLYNPIITTVHSDQYSIVNYTVYIKRTPSIMSTGHALHPGRVQRTIIVKGNEIFVTTLGDGTGALGAINESLAPGVWRDVDKKLVEALNCKASSAPTLFLFDVSGSMNNNNKWTNAKQAATSTLDFLFDEAGKSAKVPSIGLMSYSGACVDNPTTKILDFSSDKSVIKNAINSNLPQPNGSTPTPQAIYQAEIFLKQQLQSNNQCEGDLIILTDGQSTCGTIRPPGTFSQAEKKIIYSSCQSGSGSFQMRYQTIGFDIQPGSEAEKDLQYLASTHGGRYFHADNVAELKKAFEKISRVYIPIESVQSTSAISSIDKEKFNLGIGFIKTKNYDTAFSVFKKFNEKYPDDSAGIYNYAQMSEATDQYKLAAKKYLNYIEQNLLVYNRKDVEATAAKMNDYYLSHFNYQKEIVKKDQLFLKDYFKKLMNGQSIPLANEFTGFISEKSSQYDRLPTLLGVNDANIADLCKDVVGSFKLAQRRIINNIKAWDQDAVPIISNLYFKLEKLSLLIEPLQPVMFQ